MSGGGAIPDDARRVTMDLLRDLADRQRLDGVKSALDSIEASARAHELSADVTSAVPLAEAERTVVESRLRARYGDELVVRYHVEPAILGGMIVRVGDRRVDGSVAGTLGQLRQTLHGAR